MAAAAAVDEIAISVTLERAEKAGVLGGFWPWGIEMEEEGMQGGGGKAMDLFCYLVWKDQSRANMSSIHSPLLLNSQCLLWVVLNFHAILLRF